MQKFIDRGFGKQNRPKVDHLISDRVGIEHGAYRILHPGIGHQNPYSGKTGAYRRQPGGGEVKALAYLVPAKEHNGNEGAFQKKGHNAFNCQRSAKNISNKPRVIAPVGAELKLKNDARGYSNGEVDAEEFHPELDRKSTRLNSSHVRISYAVFCLK